MKCPCRGCYPPKRKLYCKSTCKEWAEWVKQEEEKKETERKRKIFTKSETAKRMIWSSMKPRR